MPPSDAADLSALTGVRSGKKSYYVELRQTEERMTSAVRALEGISSSLVRTRDDPRGLLRTVLHAAGGHLGAEWTLLALRDSALPGLRTRFLAAEWTGGVVDAERSLPPELRERLRSVRRGRESPAADGWVQVPMSLDGEVLGQLAVSHQPGVAVDPEDLWVLRILANQAAMAIHTATLYSTATDLRARAQRLYNEIARNSQDLQTRTAELERAEGRLQVLHQRELLDAERHRIALELHDSVAQYVLSAGFAVDLCRSQAVDTEGPDAASVQRLSHARDLVAKAGEQVRSVIYALHHEPAGDEVATLSDLLDGLAAQHRPTLAVSVRVLGVPVPLGAKAEHALARIAGEALFNVSIHARASKANVALTYRRSGGVVLAIGDDGCGDPRELRRRLRLSMAAAADGRHQGLANMADRARDVNGAFAIRRARLGGVRIEVAVP